MKNIRKKDYSHLSLFWKDIGLSEVKSYALATVHGIVNSAYFIVLIQCLLFWEGKEPPHMAIHVCINLCVHMLHPEQKGELRRLQQEKISAKHHFPRGGK